MTSQVRTALLSFILTLTGILTVPLTPTLMAAAFREPTLSERAAARRAYGRFHKMVLIKAPARRKWPAVLVTYRVPGKRPRLENCARQVWLLLLVAATAT